MIWYTGMCGIMAISLLYGLTLWSMCVWGRGDFGSNGLVIKTQPFIIDDHYRTDIIIGVGYPRSNSIVSLVLCTVAVRDSINLVKKG
jgi:hypothetical protein